MQRDAVERPMRAVRQELLQVGALRLGMHTSTEEMMNQARVVIRRAQVADVSNVEIVARATWPVTYAGIIPDDIQRRLLDSWYSPESLRRALATPGSSLFVAESNGDVMGFAQFCAAAAGRGGAHANLCLA